MIKAETLSEEAWKEWLQHPVTRRLREVAAERKLELMEKWAAGDFTASFTNEMIAKNAGATGACSIWDEIQEMDFSLIEGDTDGKQERAPAPGQSNPT